MTKIAIDVVLLPDSNMINTCLELNTRLVQEFKSTIILGSTINIPHISLCMGAVAIENLSKVNETLRRIATHYSVFQFKGKLQAQGSINQKNTIWIDIDKEAVLQQLQAKVMNQLWKYLSFNFDRSSI